MQGNGISQPSCVPETVPSFGPWAKRGWIYTVRLKEFENSLSQIGTESEGKSKKTARTKESKILREREREEKKEGKGTFPS